MESKGKISKSRWLAILVQIEVWKRRNTLCISSFQTDEVQQKGRQLPQMIFSLFSKDKKGCDEDGSVIRFSESRRLV